jgi:hypothetical protein
VHVVATIKNMVGHISASHCGRARFCGVPSEEYGDAELLVALSTDQGSGKRRACAGIATPHLQKTESREQCCRQVP